MPALRSVTSQRPERRHNQKATNPTQLGPTGPNLRAEHFAVESTLEVRWGSGRAPGGASHNPLVVGSNPTGPTSLINDSPARRWVVAGRLPIRSHGAFYYSPPWAGSLIRLGNTWRTRRRRGPRAGNFSGWMVLSTMFSSITQRSWLTPSNLWWRRFGLNRLLKPSTTPEVFYCAGGHH